MNDALSATPSAEIRGVVHFDGPLLITDRVELTNMSTWFAHDPGPQPTFAAQGVVRNAINQHKGKLTGFNDPTNPLYKKDGSAIFGFGESGFDCDDFADALGVYLEKNVPGGATASTVRCTWTAQSGQGKSKSAHRITRLELGGGRTYWLIDAQTGLAVGPFNASTPMDASPLVGSYPGLVPGTVHTSQGTRDIGDRGWAEPPAWHESRDMVQHFESVTNFDSACFSP